MLVLTRAAALLPTVAVRLPDVIVVMCHLKESLWLDIDGAFPNDFWWTFA